MCGCKWHRPDAAGADQDAAGSEEPSSSLSIVCLPADFCPHMAGHLFMTSALRGASFFGLTDYVPRANRPVRASEGGRRGMAYGVSATTVLLGLGVAPSVASASVHAAEVFTTGASGAAHVI